MALPAGCKIYFTSPDGSQRRSVPRLNLNTVQTQIDRLGGYGPATFATTIPFHLRGTLNVQIGDRVEVWYQGARRYRGYVSGFQPKGQEPRNLTVTAYGAAQILQKQFCDKAYAFPSGGVDIQAAFAQIANDFLLKATGPGGFKLIQSTHILPIGTTIQNLDARRKLSGDAIRALVKEAGSLAVWGVDADASDNNRLFVRPVGTAAAPTHTLFVPSQMVESSTGEQQTADLINQILITGGNATYPNLLHNGGFELPVQQADGAGNLIANGGFDTATDDHHVGNWNINSGASSFTTFSFPPKQAAPYSGTRCMGLEGLNQNVTQNVPATFVAGHNYIFSVRAAKEMDEQVATGHATLSLLDGNGNVLRAITVALTPGGQGYDYFSGAFAAPAGVVRLSVLLAMDTLDSSMVAHNDGYTGGLLLDDVQCYDIGVVYQDGWYVDAVDQTVAFQNAVNWVYQDSAFEGAYCVYLDAASTDVDGHDLKLQPLESQRFKVTAAQSLRYGVWLKSPPASLNPNPPKFNLEFRLYDSAGKLTHTPRQSFQPGFLAQWTYFELVCFATAGDVAADANITWRSAGSLLVDAQSVRDAQAPPMAAGSGATVPLAPYLPDGPLTYFLKASDPYLNTVWRPANGLASPAPYATSEAVYGPRCGVFSDSSILLLSDACAVADSTFTGQAFPLYRPDVTLLSDPRLYWPGETVRLLGTDGPVLSPTPLPIARVVDTWTDAILRTELQMQTEQPDVTLVVKRIVQEELGRLGPGSGGGGGGGGYSSASGGGAGSTTSPAFRTTLAASPTDPTLHDAYTAAPHASQASQAGWTGTTAEVVAGRTRTAKGVSSTSLEGRLDSMEVDITAKEPGLGNPSADGYVLSSTAAGARAWSVPQAGPQGPAGAAGQTGQAGAQGPVGNTGTAGATGATGPTGLTGVQGTTGAAGTQGPAGPQGASAIREFVTVLARPGAVSTSLSLTPITCPPGVTLTLIGLRSTLGTAGTTATTLALSKSPGTGAASSTSGFSAASSSQTVTIASGNKAANSDTISTAFTLSPGDQVDLNVTAAGTSAAGLTVEAIWSY